MSDEVYKRKFDTFHRNGAGAEKKRRITASMKQSLRTSMGMESPMLRGYLKKKSPALLGRWQKSYIELKDRKL